MNTTRKKIGLFLNARPHDGGAFQYSQSILEAIAALPRDRYAPLVAFTNRDWLDAIEAKALPSLFLSTGIWGFFARKKISTLLPIPWWRRISPYLSLLIRTMKKQACHLWIFPAQDTWTYLCPFPALSTVYDLMHRYESRFPEVGSRGIYNNRERHYRQICRWAKGILVDSPIGQQQLMESYGIAQDKIHILPYVASRPTTTYILETLTHFNLPDKFLFYPAQFWKHKNHQGLVEEVHELRNQIPDLRLVFSGVEKNCYGAVQQLIHRLDLNNFIRFTGYVSDRIMPMLYQRARGLIMPTFFGPTNIPPLEAMAEGCPVAVSDIYGMREQLGDAALYFNPSSIADIATAIRTIWTDDELCRELSQRGLQHHRQWNPHHFNDRLRVILQAITLDE